MIALEEIIGALETTSDEHSCYYDRLEDRIVEGPSDVDSFDDGDSAPEWQKEQAELDRLIQEDEEAAWEQGQAKQRRFIPLPDRFEIDEWHMMERFAAGQDDQSQADQLLGAIHGRGAFRYFKDTIHRLGLAEKWYAFRQERYGEIAREFCLEHGIAFRE
jgi:hypothetical protein